jgi:hypothetical protein
MRINLDDGYYIKDDGVGFAFGRVITPKATPEGTLRDPYESNICFPATLESAIRRYAREANLDYEGTLSGYVDRISETITRATKNIQI